MFLKRLTMSGFKSFAAKTVLEFEPGMTCVVGPNGSGKSNIADAIRWVLGEQSSKSLRTKKGEEIIFAGTEKRAKASVAEVSLLLDNSDRKVTLDFSEIELARRLYRSGESEYRLNGRKVTLREIQQLLISAGFGPNSYSVIGQGMIDQLILASPAERKLLFDEASGIRGYELKREQALRKLEATEANLVRLNDILTELAPRLVSLGRSAEAAKARQGLVAELEDKRQLYVLTAERHLTSQRLAAQETLAEIGRQIETAQVSIKQLESQRISVATPPAPQPALLHEQEILRDQLGNELGVKRAELAFLVDKRGDLESDQAKLAQTEREAAAVKRRRQQITHQLAEAQVEETEAADRLSDIAKVIDKTQARLAALRRQSDQTSRHEYVTHALTILKQVSYSLGAGSMTSEEIRLLVYKAGRLLSHASVGQEEIIADIRQAQTELTNVMRQREEAHEPYTNAVIKVRSLELDLAHAEERMAATTDELQAVTKIKAEIKSIDQQMSERRKHIARLERSLEDTNTKLQELRRQASEQASAQQDTEAIFKLASELEAAKTAIEGLATRRSDIQDQLEDAQAQLAKVAALREEWFGSRRLVMPTTAKTPEELEVELAVLAGRLHDTEDADTAVLEEYQEASERHSFLASQVADLTAAKADLEKVIVELEKLIKARFEAAFTEMGRHFEHYFTKLFDGGKAGLSLRPDATGAYGIEITAVPPGKRVESLATLSGGERSLTGTALLAAILTINPSPFVVLDEIDAALDEANSARLGAILAGLTKHSQLIAISHNRQIMTAAKALYGVTMDQHHVSKVLSVRLEMAGEMAARQ